MALNNTLRDYGSNVTRPPFSHTVYGVDKFNVPSGKRGEFFRGYCLVLKDELEKYEQPDPESKHSVAAIGGVMEKLPGDAMPIIVDVMLRFKDEPDIPYDIEFTNRIVHTIQHVLKRRYDLDDLTDPESYLRCVVTCTKGGFILRPNPKQRSKLWTYQIRFYFPLFRVSTKSVAATVNEVVDELRRKNVLRILEQSPVGDWDNIIRTYDALALPMYGSSENELYPPCLFWYAIDDTTDITNEEDLVEVDIIEENGDESIDLFDVHESFMIRSNMADAGLFDDLSDIDALPLILSHWFSGEVIPLLPQEGGSMLSTPLQSLSITDFNSRHYKTEGEMAIELLELVSPDRFTNRKRWIEIGKALHNTFRAGEKGLSVWIDATKAAYKRRRCIFKATSDMTVEQIIETECETEYNDFVFPGTVTVKTLAWFASEDNKESYDIWHRNWSCPYRQDCYDMTHYSLCKALYCELWLVYAVASHERKKVVYEFAQHQWRKVDDGYKIRIDISERFREQFVRDRSDICERIATTNDENERKKLEEQNKVVNKLITQLRMRPFKASVLADVLDQLTIPDFESLLDRDDELTGHPNGVTEVSEHEGTIEFRPGKPEDYIMRSTSAKMDLTLSWDHPRVKEFLKWMSEMFMDKNTCHFVLLLFATGFIAGNKDKIAAFFTGDKNNGKSTLSNFILKTWGKYAVKFPTTGLTKGYGDSGSANPAMVRISGPRWGLADEPDSAERFHAGPFKRVFGNDVFFDRGLYSEGGDLDSTCTVTVWSNKIPSFPNADDACRIRMCCIPCKTTYVQRGAPETEEERREKRILPMNSSFQRTVDRLRSAALWVAYKMFPEWCEKKLVKDLWPDEVKEATEEYWQENDMYYMYMSDQLDRNADPTEYVTVTALYKDFEAWFMMYNKGEQVPNRSDVKYHMVQHLTRTINNRWYGVRLIKNESNERGPRDAPIMNRTPVKASSTLNVPNVPAPTTAPTTLSLRPQPTSMVTGQLDVTSSGKIIGKPVYEKAPEEEDYTLLTMQ